MSQTPPPTLQWTVQSTSLEKGAEVELVLSCGSAAQPLHHVKGFEGQFTLHTGMELPGMSELDDSGSWLVVNVASYATLRIDQNTNSFVLRAEVPEEKSGAGEILRIRLKVKSAGVVAGQVVSTGGGIMIIDDVGFKRGGAFAASPEALTPKCYPNPCTDKFVLDWGSESFQRAEIYDSEGRLMRKVIAGTARVQDVEMSDLRSGMYHVILRSDAGNAQQLNLLKR